MITNEGRIKICKQCSNKGSDFGLGLICDLTGKVPDFEEKSLMSI